jgi:hypothetical protein
MSKSLTARNYIPSPLNHHRINRIFKSQCILFYEECNSLGFLGPTLAKYINLLFYDLNRCDELCEIKFLIS